MAKVELRHEICFEFRDPQVPGEQIGWVYAVRGLHLGQLKGRPGSVALVVDHGLGDLEVFNRRQKRIAGMIYLPPEFTLVYASAERGQSQFVNSAMSFADWASTRALDVILANPSERDGLEPAPLGEPFTFRRIFRPDGYEPYDSSDKMKQTVRFKRI
jgi:hypothetical protein